MKKLTQAIATAAVTVAIAAMSTGISEAGPGNQFRPSLNTPQRHEAMQVEVGHETMQKKSFVASEAVQRMMQAKRIKDCQKLQAGNTKVWVTWDPVKKIWYCHSEFDHFVPMYQ